MHEVIRMTENRLSRQVWNLHVDSYSRSDYVTLVPHEYLVQERETTRHGWKTVRKWSRFDERPYNSQIKREDVPIPADVVEEMRQRLQVVMK